MSFLSRKPARPDGRGRGGDGYDDYADDGYADDGYAQSDDDGWSPNEYFSPEGIKGKWAGETPAGRAGGRGRRDEVSDPGRNSYGNDSNSPDYGGTGGAGGTRYGDEFESGLYDLPDGADEDRGDRRRGRRSKDREDRGERTGILRLRRDRGEDIWPDDGISDEDYWASVASDRPLNGADSPPGASSAPGAARGGDQRSERGAAGRLGPPPGLAGDYKGSGTAGAPGQPGRTVSGPMSARPATGPHPVRPKTGPTATVGVTSSRPPTGPNSARSGPMKSGPGSGGFPQSPARPSFQPNASRSQGMPGAGRQHDWGDRTERIERVNASGYPEPRPSGRGQGPAPAAGRGASGPLGLGAGSAGRSPSGPLGAPVPGRGDNPGRSPSGPLGAPVPGRGDNPAWRAPDRHAPDRRASGTDAGREVSGPWPATARDGGPARSDDDPLTSKAYSRAAMTETDGRSYRVAARRSQAQTMLTDHAETFIGSHPQQPAQAQQGRGGEYWQYPDDSHASSQQPGGWHTPAGRGQPGQGLPGPGQPGPAPAPGRAAQPAHTQSRPSGQYEARQRPVQPRPPAAGHAPDAPSGGRAGLNPYDSAITGSYPYSSQPYPPAPVPGGPSQNGSADPRYRPPAGGYPGDGHSGAGQGRPEQGRPGYRGHPGPADRRY